MVRITYYFGDTYYRYSCIVFMNLKKRQTTVIRNVVFSKQVLLKMSSLNSLQIVHCKIEKKKSVTGFCQIKKKVIRFSANYKL